jgi:hypothetical protein
MTGPRDHEALGEHVYGSLLVNKRIAWAAERRQMCVKTP